MSSGSILFMVLICGVIWGGFIVCLIVLSRQSDDEA